MKQLSHTARVYVGDSDDSDTEGGLGNVERVVMRPPGHSGKAKQGHLCFDASFETGNLGRVDFITENEYDLFIRPDTANPRIRGWFHFSVENVQPDQRVIFNIVNLSKVRNLFQRGMTPVVKSSRRRKWQRLPSRQTYYYRSPDHNGSSVLSFAFAFDKHRPDHERYFFALSFPYSYSRCREFLKRIGSERQNKVQVGIVAKSVQKRDVPIVFVEQQAKDEKDQRCITPQSSDDETDDEEDEEEQKPSVIILARSHPGDANTSFVAQGIIEFLTSDHTIAKELRAKVNFIIFPMMNPDGVFLGNARSSLLGVDFNRSWNKLGSCFPELHGIREFMLRARKERRLEFVLDLHANICVPGLWVQGNSFDSVYRFERHIVFPKMLALNCPDFEADCAMYNSDVEKEGTCRRFMSVNTNDPTLTNGIDCAPTNTYSVEISVFGYTDSDSSAKSGNSSNAEIYAYSEEDYLMHGRRICRTLWEYYKVTGVIESKFKPQNEIAIEQQQQQQQQQQGDAASFSMMRLRSIAQQRDIFSSLESLSNEENKLPTLTKRDSSSSDEDNYDGRRRVRLPRASELIRRESSRQIEVDNVANEDFLTINGHKSHKNASKDEELEDDEDWRRYLTMTTSRRHRKLEESEFGSMQVIGQNIAKPNQEVNDYHGKNGDQDSNPDDNQQPTFLSIFLDPRLPSSSSMPSFSAVSPSPSSALTVRSISPIICQAPVLTQQRKKSSTNFRRNGLQQQDGKKGSVSNRELVAN